MRCTKNKIFIKSKEKFHVKRYSWKYWFACSIEIIAIVLMAVGILEVEILHKSNPASFSIQFGGLLFVIGSFLYAKWVKH